MAAGSSEEEGAVSDGREELNGLEVLTGLGEFDVIAGRGVSELESELEDSGREDSGREVDGCEVAGDDSSGCELSEPDGAGPAGSADGAEGVPPSQVRFGFEEPKALSRFRRASSGGMGVDSTRRTGS